MGKLGSNILQGVRSLFGKSTANVDPVNLDIIQFDSATQEWILVSAVVGQAVQSASNVGTGEGVSLPRVGDDLPFRSLTTTSKISLTGSATEIEIDIGTLLISDIQGLQTALDNLEPPFLISDITGLQTALDSKLESPIAISDTTGLQTALDSKLESPIAISDTTGLQLALDSKIETVTNVGGEKELIKAKVSQDIPVRTLKAGTGITLNQNTDDIEIVATAVSSPSFIIQCYGKEVTNGIDFMALVGKTDEVNVESERQTPMPNDGTFSRLTFEIPEQKNASQTITLRKNGADGNQSLIIPASTTGTFQDLSNTDSFVNGDKFSYKLDITGSGTFSVQASAMELST